MGMAASQARYLALVARKSNCEYEGQQINQSRLVLANQTANLFNQMLGLNVPVPPSTQDYTKTQYSFTDGVNNVTMDSWKQLGTSDENYNYVVTYHYNSDIYTGSQKKMNDPQVQFTTSGTSTDLSALTAATTRYTSAAIDYKKILEDYEKLQANLAAAQKAKAEADEAYNVAVEAKNKAEAARDEAFTAYQAAQSARSNYEDGDYATISGRYNTAKTQLETDQNNAKDLSQYKESSLFGNSSNIEKTSDGCTIKGNSYFSYTNLGEDSGNKTIIDNAINDLIKIGALDSTFDKSNIYYQSSSAGLYMIFDSDIQKALASASDVEIPRYEAESVSGKVADKQNLISADETALANVQPSYDAANERLNSLKADESSAKSVYDLAEATLAETNKTFVTAAAAQIDADANLTKAQNELDIFETENDTVINEYNAAKEAYEALQTPEYIGNCKLQYLDTLTKEQEAELRQVVKDMQAQSIDADMNSCFDEDGNYIGGVYQFKLNGQTYYSTIEGLYNSFNTGTGPNHIDDQDRLAYYNASYVSTKIEDTKKALLETDSTGRFTSIRLEDDTVTFALNAETITDDAAYQDAMNQYYYKNAQYDKMVQDINAKTSLIHQEDQQLELRLKQLDTEQNALSQEMDAVQKVVKDNVEKSFKTFGG